MRVDLIGQMKTEYSTVIYVYLHMYMQKNTLNVTEVVPMSIALNKRYGLFDN